MKRKRHNENVVEQNDRLTPHKSSCLAALTKFLLRKNFFYAENILEIVSREK